MLRLLTGTDRTLRLSSASLTSALICTDDVILDQNSSRPTVSVDLNPDKRLKTGISFKTLVAAAGNQMNSQSADFCYDHELNAAAMVKKQTPDTLRISHQRLKPPMDSLSGTQVGR